MITTVERRTRGAAGLVLAAVELAVGACGAGGQPLQERGGNPGGSTSTAMPRSTSAAHDMVAVPAGRYPIGRDTGPTSQRPRHLVALDAFRIDRTEVTNAAFAGYLNALRLPVRGSFGAGGITDVNGPRDTVRMLGTRPDGETYKPLIELDDEDARIVLVDGRFEPARGYADHPVTEVTWTGARAYCVWRGGDLPTEAQWEAAARGNGDRRFPWGDAPPDRERMVGGGHVADSAPVGSRPKGASPFGVLDAAGNLAEWTRSLKRPYPYRADDGRESLTASGERTTRGGDYEYDSRPINYSVSFRDGFSNDPVHGHRHVGFRCAAADR